MMEAESEAAASPGMPGASRTGKEGFFFLSHDLFVYIYISSLSGQQTYLLVAGTIIYSSFTTGSVLN